MTKAKTPVPTEVETKLGPIVVGKPASMHIVGPAPLALAQAVVHIRSGYKFSDLPVEFLGASGGISFHLELGNPDSEIIKLAEASCADALAVEACQRQKDIEAAAARMYADKLRADEQAVIAAEIAEQEAALQKLQQAMTEAKAKLA